MLDGTRSRRASASSRSSSPTTRRRRARARASPTGLRDGRRRRARARCRRSSARSGPARSMPPDARRRRPTLDFASTPTEVLRAAIARSTAPAARPRPGRPPRRRPRRRAPGAGRDPPAALRPAHLPRAARPEWDESLRDELQVARRRSSARSATPTCCSTGSSARVAELPDDRRRRRASACSTCSRAERDARARRAARRDALRPLPRAARPPARGVARACRVVRPTAPTSSSSSATSSREAVEASCATPSTTLDDDPPDDELHAVRIRAKRVPVRRRGGRARGRQGGQALRRGGRRASRTCSASTRTRSSPGSGCATHVPAGDGGAAFVAGELAADRSAPRPTRRATQWPAAWKRGEAHEAPRGGCEPSGADRPRRRRHRARGAAPTASCAGAPRPPAPLRRLEPAQGQGRPGRARRGDRPARGRGGDRPTLHARRTRRDETRYRDSKGRDKVVHYWLMEPESRRRRRVRAQRRGRRAALVHASPKRPSASTYAHDRKLLAEGAGARDDRLPRPPRQGRQPRRAGRTTTLRPAVEGRAARRPTASPTRSRDERDRPDPVEPLRPVPSRRSSRSPTTRRPRRRARPTRSPRARRSPTRCGCSRRCRTATSVLCTHGDVMQRPARPLRTPRREARRPPDREGLDLGVRDRRRHGASRPVRAAAEDLSFTRRSPAGRRSDGRAPGPPVRWTACASSSPTTTASTPPASTPLAAALVADGHDVLVVAPTDDRSGAGASIGRLHRRRSTAGRATRRGTSSPTCRCTPSTRRRRPRCSPPCLGAFGDLPDLIASGINPGANTGHLVLHSGTVGATLTGAGLRHPRRRGVDRLEHGRRVPLGHRGAHGRRGGRVGGEARRRRRACSTSTCPNLPLARDQGRARGRARAGR